MRRGFGCRAVCAIRAAATVRAGRGLPGRPAGADQRIRRRARCGDRRPAPIRRAFGQERPCLDLWRPGRLGRGGTAAAAVGSLAHAVARDVAGGYDREQGPRGLTGHWLMPLDETGGSMRRVAEATFPTHDGVELFYRHWPAVGPTRTGAIVLFHRGHEHSARIAHLAEELDLPDFDVFAWDARGHGRSLGARGYSPSLGASVRDVGAFMAHIGTAHGIAEQDMAVVAQSVGAVLVSTW